MTRPSTANYSQPIPDPDECLLLTIQEYLEDVGNGMLTDDDGIGEVAKDGLFAPAEWDEELGWPKYTKPSEGVEVIPLDSTHIVWYGK